MVPDLGDGGSNALVIFAVNPARGAPLEDLVPAAIVAVIAAAALLVVAVGHRRRWFPLLAALGGFSERVSGMPRWTAIPSAVTSVSLVIAVFGFYWDVSWHIDRGRDPGPLANPAHWFILVGLAGVFLAGVLSLVLGDGRRTRASIKVGHDWHVPAGGVLLFICGFIALAGFPLDDVWHRLFGQDVTLWGPTHIQMIGGASLATLAMMVLLVEGPPGGSQRRWLRPRKVVAGGAFLLGLSTLQGEFDFGVPQFNQAYHPVLIMLAAGIGLVAVRIWAGRGAALGAAVFFLAVRIGLAVLIGPVLERSLLHFPLYLVEALVVEAVAMRVAADRPLTLALWSGAGIGTLGLAAEWGWSHVFMPLPWRAALFPEGALLGLVAALSGSVIGAMIGRALSSGDAPVRPVPRRWAAAASIAALFVLAWPLPLTAHPYRAEITLTDVARPGPERWADVTARLSPPDAARGARWFNVTAWQGRPVGDHGLELTDMRVTAELRRVGPGTYRSEKPVPVSGSWKTLLRLHRGHSMQAAPVWLPADPAIPAPMVAALPRANRTFTADKQLLQREATTDNVWLERGAYLVLLAIGVGWIASMAWGLRRLARGASVIPYGTGAVDSAREPVPSDVAR